MLESLFSASSIDYTEQATLLGVYSAFGIGTIIYYLLTAVSLWKVLDKAGLPGWTAFIPIVNAYFVLKAVGRPWWWLLLYLIPVVGVVIAIVVAFNLGDAFDRGPWFSLFLLWVFPFIGYLILGFGDAKYRAPVRGYAV